MSAAGRVFRDIATACGNWMQKHPVSWKMAWEAVHKLPFLLPHDKSYAALRHFIAVAPSGLFLDVGANDGISALSFRRFSRNYRILSLEPNKLLEAPLRRMKSSDAFFDYRMIGAGSEAGQVKLFMPAYNGISLHTFTSVSRPQVEQAIAEHFGPRIAANTTIEEIDGDIVRLDDLRLDPSIVKIDAEGNDYNVLVGLEDTIARARPFLMIEIAWTERARVAALLQRHDYLLCTYDIGSDRFRTGIGEIQPGGADQRNVFAIPQETLNRLPLAPATGGRAP